MTQATAVACTALFFALVSGAAKSAGSAEPWPNGDVVPEVVPDKLARVTLNQQELDGEIGRRLHNLIYRNFMVLDLDGKWLDHFRQRRDRGDQSHVYYGIGKVLDAGSLFAAYTGDPRVARRNQYIIDELVKSRDADGYIGFWNVEPGNRQDYINWTLHEQEYINLAFVRHYRCTGSAQSLAHARLMADYILATFPTPQNPRYDAGLICTAGLPEGMLELYRVTGDRVYLEFAADVPHGNNRAEIQLASLRTWEQDFSRRPCHVYVMLARCYAQTELYRLTGEQNLLHMSHFMRNELLKQGDGGLLVTGSCSEGEHFTYDQQGRGAIGESCVTAYMLRWIDSLMRLDGDMRYGDLLERAIYNALLAANSPDGRWIRYFTPFSGDRQYDTRDFFCCCGNYRRAVAELPQKVYYRTPGGGIALNLFTNSHKAFVVSGETVTVRQDTAYPNDGLVKISLAVSNPVDFPLQFRTPRWCKSVQVQVNDDTPIEIDPAHQPLGCCVLNRTWRDGDALQIKMPIGWRFVRGRAAQEGLIALLRGPIVYCLGEDQNADLLARCPEPRDLAIDPASIGQPIRDDSIRPGGMKVAAKAWLNADCTGDQVAITLTEFIDPSGKEVYFRLPQTKDRWPVPLQNDELVSWPNEYVSAHVVRALYGPKAEGTPEDLFEVRGDLVADLAADYVKPNGSQGRSGRFADSTGGRWELYNCRNQGLLSTAAARDVNLLNSQFKAFGTPDGYAYGLEGQDDQLGFVSDYAPSDRQEQAWRDHYTQGMFDKVLMEDERTRYLYTHPISDTTCYNVFRWTPAASLRQEPVVLCGKLVSNLGNGVQLRVIRWNSDSQHDALTTCNTSERTLGNCGAAEFMLQLPPHQLGQHLDFVLHNAGSHICDATAIQIRVLTNVATIDNQTDVTDQVQARFHNCMVTQLGPYAELFGDGVPRADRTLKVKLHFWRDGRVRYHELPPDSPLDLTQLAPDG